MPLPELRAPDQPPQARPLNDYNQALANLGLPLATSVESAKSQLSAALAQIDNPSPAFAHRVTSGIFNALGSADLESLTPAASRSTTFWFATMPIDKSSKLFPSIVW
jgi:hypothetical protein